MARRKNLDIYFILDSLYRRAFEELQKSLDAMLNTGDYVSPKLHAKICKNYERNYDNTISAIDKEYKRLLKRRKKAQKKGFIDHNQEIYYLLQQSGVYFLEDLEEGPEETPEEPAPDNVVQQSQTISTENDVNVADAENVKDEQAEEDAKNEPAPEEAPEDTDKPEDTTEEETPESDLGQEVWPEDAL